MNRAKSFRFDLHGLIGNGTDLSHSKLGEVNVGVDRREVRPFQDCRLGAIQFWLRQKTSEMTEILFRIGKSRDHQNAPQACIGEGPFVVRVLKSAELRWESKSIQSAPVPASSSVGEFRMQGNGPAEPSTFLPSSRAVGTSAEST